MILNKKLVLIHIKLKMVQIRLRQLHCDVKRLQFGRNGGPVHIIKKDVIT